MYLYHDEAAVGLPGTKIMSFAFAFVLNASLMILVDTFKRDQFLFTIIFILGIYINR